MFTQKKQKHLVIIVNKPQKSIEKLLYYKQNNIDIIKTHDLIALCQLCMTIDNSFSNMLDCCSRLNPYGVAVRYPNELSVDETIAKNAIIMAQKVHGFCYEKIDTLINDKKQ